MMGRPSLSCLVSGTYKLAVPIHSEVMNVHTVWYKCNSAVGENVTESY